MTIKHGFIFILSMAIKNPTTEVVVNYTIEIVDVLLKELKNEVVPRTNSFAWI